MPWRSSPSMAIRRARRSGMPPELFQVREDTRRSSFACWYCDLKIFTFNDVLHSLGQKYAKFLRNWMTFGVAFSGISLFGVTMMLFLEATAGLHFHSWSFVFNDILLYQFWGISPLVSGLSISIMDFTVTVFSTVISVTFHELGHAVAAASEGVPVEYVAIFLAVIFPGALVAFNNDLLQSLPTISTLRIYCAGIWHNAVLSAVCKVALVILPFTLQPLYIHGENVMVVGISSTSSLSGYLSRGDVILTMDGESIHSPYEFIEKLAEADPKLLQGTGSSIGKGYCVPNALLEATKSVSGLKINFSCPDGHAAFISLPCQNTTSSIEISSSMLNGEYAKENKHCLIPEQVVKLGKCGEGWGGSGALRNLCPCSKEESCMTPQLRPGISWFEFSYAKPYSSECLQKSVTSLTDPCGIGTFVYVGDKLILARSIRLSAYQPRWRCLSWSMDALTTLENILSCTYHVSAALAALNSLPVFFLDGEYILETALHYITWLTPRKRRKAAKASLTAATILSFLVFFRVIHLTYNSVAKG